jgi:hypothetical protein
MGGDSGGTGRGRRRWGNGDGGISETFRGKLQSDFRLVGRGTVEVLVQNKNRLKTRANAGEARRVKVRCRLGYGILILYLGIEYNYYMCVCLL